MQAKNFVANEKKNAMLAVTIRKGKVTARMTTMMRQKMARAVRR